MSLAEQLNQCLNPGMARKSALLEHRCSTQWKQPYHRANLQALGIAVWEMKDIVKEPILRVPHLIAICADSIHGVGNPRPMLKEAERDFLINLVMVSEDDCNFQHA